jgi:hypothetical protein
MSDIFISYSSADRERARLMAQALEQRGWSVWWDREIPPGRAYDDVIEEALDAARCVVVLWSKSSAASTWVRNEASDAMQRKVLIPALIDADVKIPLEFRRLQAADLSRWQGEPSTEFEQFCEAVARNVQAAPGAAPPPGARPPPRPGPAPVAAPTSPVAPAAKSSKALWISIGVGVLVAAGIASVVNDREAERKVPISPVKPAPLIDTPAVPAPRPAVPANPNPGASWSLMWRDHALRYDGIFTMRAGSTDAHLSVDVHDWRTGRSLGHHELTAHGRTVPGQNIFSARVPVEGDSVTPSPHFHDVNLVFELQNGLWTFVRNCTKPGDCYETQH